MTSTEESCVEKVLLEPAIQRVGQLEILLLIIIEACQSSKILNIMDDSSVYSNADDNGAENDEDVVGERQIIRRDCGLHRW